MREEPSVQDQLQQEMHKSPKQNLQNCSGQEVSPDTQEGVSDEVHQKVQEHTKKELQNSVPTKMHKAASPKLQK